MDINVVLHCNQRCISCSHASPFTKPWTMTPEMLARDLAALKGVAHFRVLQMVGGEPTLHKDFFQITGAAKLNGLEVGLITNGSRESMLDAAANFSWVRVSMDGGTPELYSKIRRVPEDEFNKVLANVWALRQAAPDLVIGVQFMVTSVEAVEAVPEFLERLSGLGVTYATVKLPASFEWFDASFVGRLCLDLPKQVGPMRVYETRAGGERGNEGLPCWASRLNTIVGADGRVHVCCRLMEDGQYDNAYLGDLNEQTFRDLWTSTFVVDKAKALLDPKNTEGCPVCWMTKFNRTLSETTAEDLASLGFV